MIVGTAGHIDHGKTSLVRALTGVDTDRLKEEKARGISIELGYAYTPLANGDVLGFVDVPGHERFVHTMAAGASGIDFALVAIAADDGPMPQTREHLAILDLLGVAEGAVALTKIDRVDAARRETAEAKIRALLAATPFADAPWFAVNALDADDAGVTALRAHLHATAERKQARNDAGLFRLAVDRVFTLAGHGTIATGTVHAGRVRVGETVSILPSGLAARVRGIHAQGRAADTGRAGQRCAINLAGIDKSELARGAWLADPRLFAPTLRVDARVRLLAPLKDGAPVHVHLGTTHAVAHFVPLGRSSRAQLVFDAPVCAVPGDRFILRDAQAANTIGGGVVLDPFAPSRRRQTSERHAALDALEHLVAGGGVAPLLEQARYGLAIDALVRLCGLAPENIALPPATRVVATPDGDLALTADAGRRLGERAVAALAAFHDMAPEEPGADLARLRRIVAPTAAPALWRALIDALVGAGSIARSGPWLHLPQHRVTLSDEESALATALLPLVAAGRFDPPWVRDLAATLATHEEGVRRTLRKLERHGRVHQVVRDLFYDSDRVSELAALAAQLAREHGEVEAAAFRDMIGLGRKRAIQILEFFDRVGYTRRVRDAHRLRGDSVWPPVS